MPYRLRNERRAEKRGKEQGKGERERGRKSAASGEEVRGIETPRVVIGIVLGVIVGLRAGLRSGVIPSCVSPPSLSLSLSWILSSHGAENQRTP
jgi:hypothetical protein